MHEEEKYFKNYWDTPRRITHPERQHQMTKKMFKKEHESTLQVPLPKADDLFAYKAVKALREMRRQLHVLTCMY